MPEAEVLKGGDVRFFVQKDGPSPANPYEYFGRLSMDSPSQPITEPDPVYDPSSERRNQWDIVDELPKMQELGSADWTQRMDRSLRDGWKQIVKRNCRINLKAVIGSCTRPDDPSQWESQIGFRLTRVTGDFGLDGMLNPLSGDDNAVISRKGTFTFREAIELYPLRFARHADSVILAEVLDGLYTNAGSCDDCGDECERAYYLTLANAGSPGLSSQIVYSLDGEATYAALDIPTLGGLSGTRLAVVGAALAVISQANGAHHWISMSDLNDGISGWSRVASGYVAGKGPRAIYSKSPSQTFIGAAGGYIYLLSDVGSAVEVLSDGSATVQDVNDLHGHNRVIVAVCNNNAVLVSTNNGDSFALVTGPAVGIALNAVWVHDDNTWSVATADGRLFFTTNQGKTWTAKIGSGTFTTITDIVFANDMIGYLVAQRGANGLVYSTVDGGYSWQAEKPRLASLPSAERYNGVAVCGENQVSAFGRISSGGDGVVSVAT